MHFPSHGIRPPQFPGYKFHGLLQNLCESGIDFNPGPPDYSFDDINKMPHTALLSAQIAEWKEA